MSNFVIEQPEILSSPEILQIDDNSKREFLTSIAQMEHKTITTTSTKEIKEGFDASSFDNMPFLFNGLATNMFGMSSSIHKNPFFKIKEIAMDPLKSFEDRTQAVKYMQKIPHIKRDVNCIDAVTSIISDNQYLFEHRYYFFSNNEKLIKLNYELVNAGHKYVYENFDSGKLSVNKLPLIYKILSSQYILTQFPFDSFDINGVQDFLLSVANDVNTEINYRAECADILDRAGYGKYKAIGRDIIIELGDIYNENKLRTIYTNLQNVHDTTVTKRVIDTLRQLIQTVTTTRNSGEIYERLVKLTDTEQNDTCSVVDLVRREKVIESFQRIVIDTSRYEGLPMCDIMLLVWEKICTSIDKDELEHRLIDELYEMHQTCSTGHISRLINILSGFYIDIQPIKISFNDQLRSNVFARYTAAIKSLGQHLQDSIVQEMTSDNKPTIEEVKFSYSPEEELKDEFVPEYMTIEDFTETYLKAEKDFFGYE